MCLDMGPSVHTCLFVCACVHNTYIDRATYTTIGGAEPGVPWPQRTHVWVEREGEWQIFSFLIFRKHMNTLAFTFCGSWF